MKCEFCGSNIDIESDVCPYCGMKKSQFQEHRKAMKRYDRAFRRTRDTVVEQNRKFSRKAGAITIICILAAAILILLICRIQIYDIYRFSKNISLMREADEHTAKLDKLEETGHYEEFADYYLENELYFVDDKAPYSEYSLLFLLASDYEDAVTQLSALLFPTETDTVLPGDRLEYFVESYDRMVKNYNTYVADRETQLHYDESCYLEKHLDSMDAMIQNLHQFLTAYFGIDEDRIEEFQKESNAHRIMMLEEEGMLRE